MTDPNTPVPPSTEPTIVGTDEGETCCRGGCDGTMEYKRHGECTCHLSPPCGSCTDQILTCTECEFEVIEP